MTVTIMSLLQNITSLKSYGARKCLEYGEFKAQMIKKIIINATGDLEVQFKFS